MYEETRFLNQDACFLNQEGRRQFLITKGFIKGEALRLKEQIPLKSLLKRT